MGKVYYNNMGISTNAHISLINIYYTLPHSLVKGGGVSDPIRIS
jgi:hypothetical protein